MQATEKEQEERRKAAARAKLTEKEAEERSQAEAREKAAAADAARAAAAERAADKVRCSLIRRGLCRIRKWAPCSTGPFFLIIRLQS